MEKSCGLCFALMIIASINVSGSGDDAKCAAIVDRRWTTCMGFGVITHFTG